ncbi:MAG: Integral membrane protein MviN [Candidatus Uhrbacteria bacterium GW2011_GWE2_45_35]|uniref:Probable lipid II flippase MurJ n=2 Tax=Candidatus Uhriibacteriota TaxID=1752732 RepID=A0A0G1MIG8_9BACT|nr:MAG: Integral membrane protein MviN [Candidatus Uhrbacteria bacterium GW2011_GWF2_44_350]KKU08733.1 MAG: Integral membrane protein MviN [Candidatus Uhrbacteria bacterium GW2011_GWE2_45_35]HBR80760.1 murein biosynthesis integral membrane protein MurJ [Candidatus Uhrbacteria bacterium]HCU31877.1 murein biosynthesis integral membrane protein MurJ [Candidatus Uhrbacteria bacterium]
MALKHLNGESKTIAGAAVLLGFFSFASRIVGLVRDRILSGEFGAGDILDAYYAAFKLPDFVFNLLVVGALSAAFIPLFIKALQSKEKEAEAWRFSSNVLNLIGVFSLASAILMAIFAQPLAGLIAPGFVGEKKELVVAFTRVMLIGECFLSLSVVFGSVLQGLKRFFLYATAPIFYNLGIIIGALFLVPIFGPIGLAWGVVLGTFVHCLIQMIGVFGLGYRYQWVFNFKDRAIVEMIKMTGPRVLGLAVSQVNIVITTVLASLLPAGGLTMFNFASNIAYFPIGIIGVSYAVAIFPSLSEYAETKQIEKLISAVSSGVRQVLFLIVPCSVVFLLLRAQIVRVVVGAGKFGWEETIITADALALITIGFFALCLNFLLVRAFFALHDTLTPFIAGLISALVNVAAAWFFLSRYGVLALGGAMSFSAVVNFILLWVALRVRLGTLEETKILRSLAVITVAGLFAGLTIQAVKPLIVEYISLDTFFGVLSQGLIAGGLGLAVYLAITLVFKLPEAQTFTSALRRKFLRGYQPKETVPTTTAT